MSIRPSPSYSPFAAKGEDGGLRLFGSNRKSFRDQTSLFAFVEGERADGGTGTGIATGVANFATKHGAQARFDETPRPHVLRFFLAPNQSCFFREGFNGRAQLFLIQRIELLDADDRAVTDFFFFGLAAAASDRGYRVRNDFVKFSAGEILCA